MGLRSSGRAPPSPGMSAFAIAGSNGQGEASGGLVLQRIACSFVALTAQRTCACARIRSCSHSPVGA